MFVFYVDSVCLCFLLNFLHAENVRAFSGGNQDENKGNQDDSEQDSESDSCG